MDAGICHSTISQLNSSPVALSGLRAQLNSMNSVFNESRRLTQTLKSSLKENRFNNTNRKSVNFSSFPGLTSFQCTSAGGRDPVVSQEISFRLPVRSGVRLLMIATCRGFTVRYEFCVFKAEKWRGGASRGGWMECVEVKQEYTKGNIVGCRSGSRGKRQSIGIGDRSRTQCTRIEGQDRSQSIRRPGEAARP